MGVIQMNARCAKCATMRVWSAHAVGNPTDRDRSAEHAVAADRFAPEIVRFLTRFGRALAAAERQPVGRHAINVMPLDCSDLCYHLARPPCAYRQLAKERR